MTREKGFTLIELMIVIAIIAIIAAIAIPGLLSSQRASNERNASGSLKTIGTVQIDFRANDRDGDRINNFWTEDVQGLYDLNDLTGQPVRLIEVTIARADGDVGAAGPNGRAGIVPVPPAPKSGYWYVSFDTYEVPPASPDPGLYDQDGLGHHNSRWGVMAKPDNYGSSGKLHFILSEGNTMFKKDDQVIVGQGAAGFAYPLDPLDAANLYSPMD